MNPSGSGFVFTYKLTLSVISTDNYFQKILSIVISNKSYRSKNEINLPLYFYSQPLNHTWLKAWRASSV